MNIGPVRIILINSGKYNYADISIDKPVHLAGSNNAGKTTIISALQWLYIDNENSMSFSHSFAKTKNYYFKDQYSYILFECLTQEGYKTVGVRGTGILPGAHERFIFSGQYSSSDFFNDDNTTKNSDQLKAQLASKYYTVLTSSLLSAALTGIGIDKIGLKNINLGLLPTRSHNGYGKFRKIYHNLLNLSNVNQKELTRAIIHTCENRFRSKGSINLEESYTERYAQVQKKRDQLKVLESAEKYIRECLRLNTERIKFRSVLKIGYEKITTEFQHLVTKNATLLKENTVQIEFLLKNSADIDSELNELKKLSTQLTFDLGGITSQISALESVEKKFASYNIQLEEQIVEGLSQKVKDLDYKLTSIDVEPLHIIEKRISKNEKALKILQERHKNLKSSLVSILQESFDNTELATFFSLCNQEILGFKNNGENLAIKDLSQLIATIKSILSQVNGDYFEDQRLKIRLSSLTPDLSSFTDPMILEKEITELGDEINKDRNILKNALGKEKYIKERDQAYKELTAKRKAYEQFLQFEGKRDELLNLRQTQKELTNSLEGSNVKITTLQQQSQSILKDIKHHKKQQSAILGEQTKTKTDIQNLRKPEDDWQVIEQTAIDEDDLRVLIAQHNDAAADELRLSREFDLNYDIIDSSTYSAYTKSNEISTLDTLREEIENIEKLKAVIETRWTNLIHALGTNMRDLLMDLDTVKSRVQEINRDINKMQISDLRSLKIRVLDTVKLTHIMRAIVEQSTNSLFSTTTISELASAIEELQRLFQTRGKIDISDLFSISFEVTKVNGETDTHTSLDSVESEGTTITIKVLINLLLLKGITDPKRQMSLPFYLDEVGRLDAENVRSIIAQAQELGFTPIIASPEPSDIVDNIYLLRSGPKGLYVDERNLITIKEH